MEPEPKVLMFAMFQKKDEMLLAPWLAHMEYERNNKKVELQGLLLMRNMTEEEALKTAEIAEPGYLTMLNVGNVEDWVAYNIGFQYAKNNNFDYIYSVRICSHPNDDALPGLLKEARKQGVGLVSARSHFMDDAEKFCVMGHVGPGNLIGQAQAGEAEAATVWMDYVSLHCTIIPKHIFGAFQMQSGKESRLRNMEYAYSDRIKKAGWKLVLVKNEIAFHLKIEKGEEGEDAISCY